MQPSGYEIRINFTLSGASASDGFEVLYGVTGSPESSWSTQNFPFEGGTITLKGLAANTSYSGKVRTLCGTGRSNWSSWGPVASTDRPVCSQGPTFFGGSPIINLRAGGLTYLFDANGVYQMLWRIRDQQNNILRHGTAIPGVEPDMQADASQDITFAALPDGYYTLEIEGKSCSSPVARLNFVLGTPDGQPTKFFGYNAVNNSRTGNLGANGTGKVTAQRWNVEYAASGIPHDWYSIALYKKSASGLYDQLVGQHSTIVALTSAASYFLFKSGGENLSPGPGFTQPVGPGSYEIIAVGRKNQLEVFSEKVRFVAPDTAPSTDGSIDLYDESIAGGNKVARLNDTASVYDLISWDGRILVMPEHDTFRFALYQRHTDGYYSRFVGARSGSIPPSVAQSYHLFGASADSQAPAAGFFAGSLFAAPIGPGSYELQFTATRNGAIVLSQSGRLTIPYRDVGGQADADGLFRFASAYYTHDALYANY